MPYDPTKPANGTPISSTEMRAQLTSLNQNIADAVNAAVAGTSSNSNAVAALGQIAQGGYDPSQMQAVLDKLDELINALRR